MNNLLLVMLISFLSVGAWSHPVWDLSHIANNSDIDNAMLETDDPRGILDFIESIISGRTTITCATEQGQKGRCSIGSCATLGQMTATKCTGRLTSFLKCCPDEKASVVNPTKEPGI